MCTFLGLASFSWHDSFEVHSFQLLPFLSLSSTSLGFSGCLAGKEPACQFRRCKRLGFDLWVGKIPWRKKWQPTPVFLPGKLYGQRWATVHRVAEILTQLNDHSDSTSLGFPGASDGKLIQLQWGRPGFSPWIRKIPLKKEMATHSSILAWRITWTEESLGSQRVWHDWVTNTFTFSTSLDEYATVYLFLLTFWYMFGLFSVLKYYF